MNHSPGATRHATSPPPGEAIASGPFGRLLAAWGPDQSSPIRGSFSSSVGLSLLLALAYFALGQIAFSLEFLDSKIPSQVFFPEGVALVFVILFGPRVVLGVLLGQFMLAHMSGLPFFTSLATGFVNMGVAALGGSLFWRWHLSPRLNRPRDIVRLVVLCALILQPLSTTGELLAQVLFNDFPSELILIGWANLWIANALGQILLVPLVLAFLSRPGTAQDRAEMFRAFQITGFYFILIGYIIISDWGAAEPVYRLLALGTFYLPLVTISALSSMRTVTIFGLLLALPMISLVYLGPDSAGYFPKSIRFLGANLLMFAGIASALLLTAFREEFMLRNRQLHEAVAARERLFAVIGHDLRGPISTLRCFLDHLIDGDLSKEDFRAMQQDLRKGVNEAQGALEGMMQWGAARESVHRPANLFKSVTNAVELLALTASAKGIRIENRVSEVAWVLGDIYQLESTFRNLLSNALKFTSSGGSVIISSSLENGFWRIDLRDSGVGMAREHVDRLFSSSNKYFSTPGTADERGLGLGLQFCREFVQLNHGTIEVSSQPSVGTTFRLRFPAVAPPKSMST